MISVTRMCSLKWVPVKQVLREQVVSLVSNHQAFTFPLCYACCYRPGTTSIAAIGPTTSSFMHLHLTFSGLVCILALWGQQEPCPFTTRLRVLKLRLPICCTLFCYPAALYGRLVFPGCILQAFDEQVGGQTEDGGYEQRLRLHIENLR
jgi:hypothetical protein